MMQFEIDLRLRGILLKRIMIDNPQNDKFYLLFEEYIQI